MIIFPEVGGAVSKTFPTAFKGGTASLTDFSYQTRTSRLFSVITFIWQTGGIK